jgi:hypothetical protein
LIVPHDTNGPDNEEQEESPPVILSVPFSSGHAREREVAQLLMVRNHVERERGEVFIATLYVNYNVNKLTAKRDTEKTNNQISEALWGAKR